MVPFHVPATTRHDSSAIPASPVPQPHRPLVAVTATLAHDASGAAPARVRTNAAYTRALEAVGLVPLVVPPFADAALAADAVTAVDGLVLTGGEDVDPARYGAAPHVALGPVNHDRDATELALVAAARERRLPVLAICRGVQLLNVALGGTLVQDLPSERPSDIQHRQAAVGWVPTHAVRIEKDSRVAACLGENEAQVNSFHHQAVDRLGDGLRIVGWAPDGTVEAIEATDRRFTVAVQWHTESMVGSPEQERLLSAFARAAEAAARAGLPRAA